MTPIYDALSVELPLPLTDDPAAKAALRALRAKLDELSRLSSRHLPRVGATALASGMFAGGDGALAPAGRTGPGRAKSSRPRRPQRGAHRAAPAA